MLAPAKKARNIGYLPLICISISMGLLLAGLWPFNFRQRNNAYWIEGQQGLRFNPYGIAFVKEPIFGEGRLIDISKPFTILLELHPREEPTESIPRILSAYDERGRELFLLGQWKSGLVLRILERERYFHLSYRETGVGKFHRDTMHSILLSSDVVNLEIYADGTPATTRPGVNFSLLSGYRGPVWLTLGNSPTGGSPWRGDLLSLSIYTQALSPAEIGSPGTKPVAQYRFAEGKGSICRGGADSRYDLVIPALFLAPGKGGLASPWQIEIYNLSFWKDVFVNILGFIPFGFAVYAWLRIIGARRSATAMGIALLLGAGISLFIELLQTYLPTRDSSPIDIMNNIFGTYLGVLFFRKSHRIFFQSNDQMTQ